jgi:uncharacterized protein (UPF0261 family)
VEAGARHREAVTHRGVLVLATLDTKGSEAQFVTEVIRQTGVRAELLDLSVFGPPGAPASIGRRAVAAAAGTDVEALRDRPRAEALAVMAAGARAIATRMLAADELAGVIAIGGSQGTVAGADVMASLPFGVPKLIVSTMASGDTRPYVGTSDITMMFPVVDLAGLNRFSRRVLENAAHAIAGMARRDPPASTSTRLAVAITMFGATTPCVEAVARGIEARGAEPVVFHANGVGGMALEQWIARGLFDAVLDVTTTELADELVGGRRSAGPDRVEAAGRRGIPQVVAPGAIDMVNFGPPETVPPHLAGRRIHRHNRATTLVRTTVEENTRLGQWLAEKLNRATGPVAIALPRRGFSVYDAEGGPFWDPDADRAFIVALRSALRPSTTVLEVDAHINAPEFAEAIVGLYGRLHG